jgi:hypothetical protein
MTDREKQKYKEIIRKFQINKNCWHYKDGSNGVSQYKDPKYKKHKIISRASCLTVRGLAL